MRRMRREDEIRELLAVDLGLLSGTQFEEYLGAVFHLHGYMVEHTGHTGDQGVDLIVSSGSSRVAVQAKCYSNSVGNDAVQQAYAGRTFYGCTSCAVITNSRFTASAVELASRLGCTLIDGDGLPSLIRGERRL